MACSTKTACQSLSVALPSTEEQTGASKKLNERSPWKSRRETSGTGEGPEGAPALPRSFKAHPVSPQLLGALLHGCCSHLTYLSLARNSCSHRWARGGREGSVVVDVHCPPILTPRGLHRKGREASPAFKQFFSSAYTLSHVNLSATRLPLEALRLGG